MKKFKRIYIEITNKCNFKCSFCPETNRKKKTMTVEEFNNVIQKIKQYTEVIYLHVKGEPLTHPNLENILSICDNNNMQVNITTNASLLEDNKEIILNSTSVRQLNISIHSIEQNKINKITEEEYIDSVINACKYIEKNSRCIIAYRLWNLDNMLNVNKNILLIDKISKAYNVENLFEKIKTNHAIILDRKVFLNLDTIFEWPSMKANFISKCGTCYGLRTQLGILVDGTVVPCCLDNEGDIKLGNIFENSLEEILNSKRATDILNGFNTSKLVEPLCQRCGFRKNKRR